MAEKLGPQMAIEPVPDNPYKYIIRLQGKSELIGKMCGNCIIHHLFKVECSMLFLEEPEKGSAELKFDSRYGKCDHPDKLLSFYKAGCAPYLVKQD